VGFEPTIPIFKRAKTLHALDREATVIGNNLHSHPNIYIYMVLENSAEEKIGTEEGESNRMLETIL
jgi:hypothetical protein